MSIADDRELVLDGIKEDLSIVAAGHPIRGLGSTFESLSVGFQALACSNLLGAMDVEGFRKNLVLSALGRRFFLRKAEERGVSGTPSHAISRTEAFLDAVAAGARDLAAEVVARSDYDWIPDGEYEDDYCYVRFLHGLIDAAAPPAIETLDRFERALEGGASVRLDLCRALVDNDQSAIEEHFLALIEEHATAVDSAPPSEDPTVRARGHIFVEGLALLEILRLRGLPLDGEYDFCPSIARASGAPPQPDDLFLEIEAQFGL